MDKRMTDSRPERYVLCVDDDPEFLKSLEVFLPQRINSGGSEAPLYRFVFLQDPFETLAVLRELVDEGSTVAMLISDQQMPSMKGTELLSQTRQVAEGSLRVLLTGHAGIEAAITAINEQLLDRYLTKPIEDEHDFTLNVQHLLQRFEMSRVIEAQSAALQGLYRFANAINSMDELDGMLEYVACFTRDALDSSEVCVLVGDESSRRRCAALTRGGSPRLIHDLGPLDGVVIEEMTCNQGTPVARVGEAPRALAVALRPHGLELGATTACTSLTSPQASLGFIVAGRRHGRAYTEHELRTLEYLADTVSIATHKQLTWAKLQEAYRLTQEQAANLQDVNQKLTLLDQMKTEFLRFISHELRTPLSYISAIGMIEGNPVDPAEHAEMTTIIRQGYERLERFIDKGLDYLNWCGTGRVEGTDVTDLTPVVRSAIDWLKKGAGRDVKVELEITGPPCLVHMEWALAEDAVRVVLENAVKFTVDEPWVRVQLGSAAGVATVSIIDRGRGFPPELAPEIFRPFTVMDTLHHREGSALNLARASVMIEAHGGRMRAESPGVGRGATFTIELPLASAPLESADDTGEEDSGRSKSGARRPVDENGADQRAA